VLAGWLAVALALLAAPAARAQTPPGTEIANTASGDFLAEGVPRAVLSNEVRVTITDGSRTPSDLAFWKYSPSAPSAAPYDVPTGECSASGTSAGPFAPQAPAVDFYGNPIDTSVSVELTPAPVLPAGEPLFLRLTDADQNLDSGTAQSALVTITSLTTGDQEVVRLYENGPDTGVFMGWIPTTASPSVPGDCVIGTAVGDEINGRYVDPVDGSDSATAAGLVDPFGRVFDSATGAMVDGATISLIDVSTGLPAVVFGDDGVSSYPATIVSGGMATDSSGRVYDFPPGGYRFPFVSPGDYFFEIEPPPSHSAPSVAGDPALQALPGAPWALRVGSRGETFTVSPGPALQIDIPVDSASAGASLRKSASKSDVDIGEFVQYTLSLSVPPGGPAMDDASLTDVLPPGFRYEEGSARRDGVALEPVVSPDGRHLVFALGDVPPGALVELRYVVRVSAETRPGTAINRARVSAQGGVVTNEASAVVEVLEDLFTERAFLVGRVMVGCCEDPTDLTHEGVPNVRVYLEDGTYVVTDDDGRYHFAAVRPGVHVVQIDVETLPEGYEPAQCGISNRHAGRAFSQFVDVQPASLWRADFYLAPPPVAALVHQLAIESSPEVLRFDLNVSANEETATDSTAVMMLPEGYHYVPGSARGSRPFEALEAEGEMLTFRLGDLAAGEGFALRFEARPGPGDEELPAERVARSYVQAVAESGARVRTPVAEIALARAVRPEGSAAPTSILEQPAQSPVPNDAGAMVEPPPAPTPASEDVQADPGASDPQRWARTSGQSELVFVPLSDPEPPPVVEDGVPEPPPPPDHAFDATWLASAEPGIAWLYPPADYAPPIPSAKVGVAHGPRQRVELVQNGASVSALNFDGVQKRADGQVVVSRWRGVDLEEGSNRFEAIVRNADGSVAETIVRTVHYAGPPMRAELVVERSHLVADGREAPVLALRLTDRDGEPARPGVVVYFDIDPPYQTAAEVEAFKRRPLEGLGAELPSSAVVGEDGIALVELHPTSVVGEAILRVRLAEHREEELRAWLAPGDREWVLVAVAHHTIGWNEDSGNDAAREAADISDDAYQEGRVAFYAKGRVTGEWILTAAYDSEDRDEGVGDRLGQVLDPDEHYTLYADGTEQGYDAPTSGHLYVKIEREKFFALYGDFETGLDESELSRYQRALHGAKTEYYGDHLRWNAFVANTDQEFARDEIRGNGTSGLYRLTRRPIVRNSEQIVIETRDRFRSEIIVSTRPLLRHIDYDIDYHSGTFFLREPLPSQDGSFDPNFLVVDYEVDTDRSEDLSGGGRLAGRLLDGRAEVGVTGIHEDRGVFDDQLYGVDGAFDVTDSLRVEGEAATTHGDSALGRKVGEAYRTELTHRGEHLDGRLYFRKQDEDFGVGQQNGAESGTRKYGAEARWRFTEHTRLDGQAFRQENLATDDRRDVADAIAEYDQGRWGLRGGGRFIRDKRVGPGESTSAGQVIGGGHLGFFDQRLVLRSDAEVAVDEDEHGEYPHRLILGADARVHERVTLFGAQEFTFGDREDTRDSRVGMRFTPWTGAEVNSSIGDGSRENGNRTYGNLGLRQNLRISERWSFDVTIDRSQTLDGSGKPAFDVDVPPPSGTVDDDFTAVSIGASHHRDDWSANGRVEARFGDREDQWGAFFGYLHDSHEDTAHSLRLEFFQLDADTGVEEIHSLASASVAHRTDPFHWIILERLDFKLDEVNAPGSRLRTAKLVNHLKMNQQWDARTQVSWAHSARYVVDGFDGEDYDAWSQLAGLEVRKDFEENWDMELHGRLRHTAGGANEFRTSAGLSIGRVVLQNVWISLGYNFEGFEDSDLANGEYTAQGPFVRLRAKVDQQSVKEALQWFSR
jgi:uncharacterized repeat protein (TIGR01451 family)